MTPKFTDKVILLTGASSGIGSACAAHFCEQGAQLMLNGRNGERLKEIAEDLKTNQRVRIHIGDLADPDYRQTLVTDTLSSFGKLDVLINNTGIIGSETFDAISLTAYQAMMNINLEAPLHLTQLAIPYLSQTKGNVVNVSSVAGLRAFPGIMSYCISKAGMDQFTRCAALELADKGIRVNAVNPGVVETRLHRNAGMDNKQYDNFLDHSKSTHPLGRVGQPAEIASLIAFLASNEADWITGATHSIDGGRAQTCAR